MKKDFFSIEDLAQGRCAVINDGSLEELREVLRRAFPDDTASVEGTHFYYEKDPFGRNWTCGSGTRLPTQSVKDFLHDFKVGDLVTWRLNGCIGTITDIRKGEAVINFGNESMTYDAKVSDLTPYYKKGDKAEVVKDLVLLGLKKGDIVEFTDDNIIDGFRLSDEALKNMIKRVRSGKLEYDISDRLEYLKRITFNVSDPESHPHYNNENGSLYKIAEQLGLNAYEFDILKRIARCRKKGQFKEDLQKIKDTVDLYLKEVDHD